MKQSQFTIVIPMDDGLLLFNTANTALVYLEPSEAQLYNQIICEELERKNEKQIAFQKQLCELGIIADNDTNEFLTLVKKYWDFRNSSDYIKVVIAPTTNCNLNCPYCFENGTHRSDMNLQTCDKISEEMRRKMQQWGTKGCALIWYGGEPLLNWKVINRLTNDLFKFCDHNGMQFNASIVTNGVLLNPQRISAMKEMGFRSIQITLDGDEKSHNSVRHFNDGGGTFNTILKNICLCSDNFDTTVRVNVGKNNINEIKKLVDYFVSINLLNIVLFFAPIEPLAGFNDRLCYTPEQFAPIQAELIKYAVESGMSKCVGLPIPHFGFCEAVSSNNFLFDPEGDHFFCWENVGRKEFTNNSAHTLSEYIKLKNYFVDTYSFHRDECENCKIFPLCLGGCPQRKLESGRAPCPPLRYNIQEIVKTYYNNFCKNEAK